VYDDILFGGLVSDPHVDLFGEVPDMEVDGLFARYCGQLDAETSLFVPEFGSGGAFEDGPGQAASMSEESEDDAENEEDATDEDLATWQSRVVRSSKPRTWEVYSSGRFQSRCFAVEWRDSVLLNQEELTRGMFRAVGGEASFMLGTEVRSSRADHMAVVRSNERILWRDCRKRLMFGHGPGDAGTEDGLFIRVRVPERKSVEGVNAFVGEMVRKCETYGETSSYNGGDLVRAHEKSYARPGRTSRKTAR
jgi:hypothetical protein